jgi:hypothetical protein
VNQLLAALAVLAGIGVDMSRKDAERVARQHGFARCHGSGGGISRALNLKGMPAFNEYRGRHELQFPRNADPTLELADEWATEHKRNRNAAKARRRALRAKGLHP